MAITRAAAGTTHRHNPWPRLWGKKAYGHHSRRSRHSLPAQHAGTTHGQGSGERRRMAITHAAASAAPRPHQEKKCPSGRTGSVLTHQALGTLWTHPGRAHTARNAKRTGNVNSDAARHGTVHSDAVCQGAVRPDAARHGICLPDGACQGIFLLDAAVSGHFPSGCSRVRAFSFWTQPCQSIFLLGAAVSRQMASGQRVS